MSSLPVESFIYHGRGIIPSNVCQQVINETEKTTWEKHGWYDVEKDSISSEKTQELDVSNILDTSFDLFQNYINDSLKTYTNLHAYRSSKTEKIVFKYSKFRMNRYSVGQMMRPHHDHIYSLFDGEEKGIPVLSIIVNFNNSYTGGDLCFWDDYVLELGQGDIIIFPSNFMYPHHVTSVLSGQRYSAVAWAW